MAHQARKFKIPVQYDGFETGEAEAAVLKTLVAANGDERSVLVALCEFLDEAERFAAARDMYDGRDIGLAQGLTVEGLSEAQMRRDAFRDRLIAFWGANLGDLQQIKFAMARHGMLP